MTTPAKDSRGTCLVASPRADADADVSMEADDSFTDSMIASPPKAEPRSRARNPTASRLFADDDDGDDFDGFKSKPASILRPLDLNLALSEEDSEKDSRGPQQRKRQAEQPLFSRDFSFEDATESPIDMYSSPSQISPACYKSPARHAIRSTTPAASKSPAYRTLDGRTVQSKNPFSPMITEETHSARTPGKPIELSDSLNFPVSFGDEGKKKGTDNQSLPNVAPLLRHRLHKRETLAETTSFYASLTRDGYPEKTGRYSFTGSPIKEIGCTNDQTSNYSHKLRRRSKGEDISAAASLMEQPNLSLKKKKNKNLHVSTGYKREQYNRSEDISPTDVMSFPFGSPSSPRSNVPPTPTKPKHYRRPSTRYVPVRKSTGPPQTPMPPRRARARARSFDMDDDSSDDQAGSSSNSSGQQYLPQSRFNSDFDVLEELGSGTFGKVLKVMSRLDGCMYAIKVAHRQAKGMSDKERMLKEVRIQGNLVCGL